MPARGHCALAKGPETTYRELCRQIDEAHAASETERLFELIRDLALRCLDLDEDAAQNATIEVFSSMARFAGNSTFHYYAKRIIQCSYKQVVQAAIDQRAKVELLDEIDPEEHLPTVVFPNKAAERVFSLRAEGHDLKEMAKMTGLGYDALRKRCERWRKEISVSTSHLDRSKHTK